MKIYTRTGDGGDTALFGGGRVSKDAVRVEAYGEVDELNAVIGWVVAAIEADDPKWEVIAVLRQLQEDLFAIGAHLATPTAGSGTGAASHLPPLPAARIAQMERLIDDSEVDLPPLRNFVLPGGTEIAARFHVTRTVCRRAERRVVALRKSEEASEDIVVYLNRLSDLLFTLARVANRRVDREDVPWVGRS